MSGASFRLRTVEDVAYMVEAITVAHQLAKLGTDYVAQRAPELSDNHFNHRKWLAGCEWSDLFGQVVRQLKESVRVD